MRLSVMVLAFVCLCAVVVGLASPLQDDDVRGAFLTSRQRKTREFERGNQTTQEKTQTDHTSEQLH